MKVGVDIGSRGVGDGSGVGLGVGVAVIAGDGDAGGRGGSCATTPSGSRNSIEIRDNAHEERDINDFLLVVIEMIPGLTGLGMIYMIILKNHVNPVKRI